MIGLPKSLNGNCTGKSERRIFPAKRVRLEGRIFSAFGYGLIIPSLINSIFRYLHWDTLIRIYFLLLLQTLNCLPGVKEYCWAVRAEQIQKFNWFNYSNRYGLEYRVRDLQNDGDYQPNWRIRYMARLEKPVKGILSREKPVSFFVSDEIFIQFGKAVRGNPNAFDQNRITIGASYEVFKNVKCSLSYLNILQQRINGKDFDNANALWLVIAFENLFGQFGKRK